MPFYDAGFFSGFLVIIPLADRIMGPFDSPDQAAKWAIDNLAAGDEWIIKPLRDPQFEAE